MDENQNASATLSFSLSLCLFPPSSFSLSLYDSMYVSCKRHLSTINVWYVLPYMWKVIVEFVYTRLLSRLNIHFINAFVAYIFDTFVFSIHSLDSTNNCISSAHKFCMFSIYMAPCVCCMLDRLNFLTPIDGWISLIDQSDFRFAKDNNCDFSHSVIYSEIWYLPFDSKWLKKKMS